MPSAGCSGRYMGWLLVIFVVVTATPGVQALSSRSILTMTSGQRPTLGLLSFDLDDTLFSTTAVVDAGNQAMLQRMAQVYQCSTDVPQFLAATRTI